MLQAEERASAKKKADTARSFYFLVYRCYKFTTGHYLVIITYFHEVIRFWLNRILWYSWENPATDFIL